MSQLLPADWHLVQAITEPSGATAGSVSNSRSLVSRVALRLARS
jgi:hypothetical protein